MKSVLVSLMIVPVLFVSVAGCGGDDDDSPEEASPRAGTEVAPMTPMLSQPPEAVLNFIEVRERQDVDAMRDLVTFTNMPCKLPSESAYAVHCLEGQASGTLVPAWPWWGCHGAFSNRGTPDQVAEFFTLEPGQLVRVLRFTPTGSLNVFPVQATLAAIFVRPADGQAWAAILDDTGLFYGMVTGCPADADQLVRLQFNGATVLYRES